MPLVSVITLSYNKPQYVVDAIESVLNQSCQDFEYFLIDDGSNEKTRKVLELYKNYPNVQFTQLNVSEEERKACYRPAMLLNEYYDKVNGKYLFFLADDDVLHKDCFKIMSEFLEANSDKHVCYHQQRVIRQYPNGRIEQDNPRDYDILFGTENQRPNCVIDGGQIMHRVSCLEKIEKPYCDTGWTHSCHADGVFMDKLTQHFIFYPIPRFLSIHRITPLSFNSKTV